MIEMRSGDILLSEAHALVNPVNCVGVMGKGLAAQFKDHFPENFMLYEEACNHGFVQIGKVFATQGKIRGQHKYIVNFPTKEHWRDSSRLEFVEQGLKALVQFLLAHEIKSVAVPPLGCGLGGLSWVIVKPLLFGTFVQYPQIQTLIYDRGQ